MPVKPDRFLDPKAQQEFAEVLAVVQQIDRLVEADPAAHAGTVVCPRCGQRVSWSCGPKPTPGASGRGRRVAARCETPSCVVFMT